MSEDQLTKAATLKASSLFIAAVGMCVMAFYVVMRDYSENDNVTYESKEKIILIETAVARNLEHALLTDRKFEAQMQTNHNLDLTVQKLNLLIETSIEP